MTLTLNDHQVLDIVNALLDKEGVGVHARVRHLRDRRGDETLRALGPVIDRYLALMEPPRTCRALHDHWEGPMICGNTLPCRTHGEG